MSHHWEQAWSLLLELATLTHDLGKGSESVSWRRQEGLQSIRMIISVIESSLEQCTAAICMHSDGSRARKQLGKLKCGLKHLQSFITVIEQHSASETATLQLDIALRPSICLIMAGTRETYISMRSCWPALSLSDDFAQRNPMLNRWLNANLQNPPSVMPWSYGLKGCSCTSPYTFQRLVTCLWPNGGADYLSCSDGNDSWIGSARLSALFGLSAIVHRRKFRHSGRPIPGQHSTDMAHDLMDFAEWRLENERCHKMREAAPIHSDAKRICFGNWQAKNDRDNWCFQPVADKSTPSAGEPASTAHGAEVTSYLATRAISFVLVAFRPLTGAELLAAVSTSFSTDGNNTPPGSPTPVVSLQLIFEVCQGHLYLDRDEVVRLREERRAQLLEQGCGMSYQEAHAMMALTCLTQMKRQPRLILKPWMDFHRFAQPANNFPFHKYLVVFWQRHYALAEKFLARIPEELHALLQNAWIGERAADEPGNDGTDTEVDCLDTWVHVEALDVGLELSKAYGFRELERTYKKLGANTARSLEEYNPRAPCATGSSNTEVNTAIGKRAVIGTHDQAQANNGNYELYQNFSDLSIADTCSGQKKATWRREEAAELAGEPWQLIESAESLTSDMEEL